VIQVEYDYLVNRTLLATKENFAKPGFKKICLSFIKLDTQYVVSKYIENIASISMHFQLSDNETGIYPPSVEILKGGKTNIGNDLSSFHKLDKKVQDKCFAVTRKFSNFLRDTNQIVYKSEKIDNIRIRGYFCLDLIVSKEKSQVFVVEVNARFAGGTGLYNILTNQAGIGSVFEHTYQCFAGQKTNFKRDFAEIQPHGVKRYAKTKTVDGLLRSAECKTINREGLDETVKQDEKTYTHIVFKRK